MKGFVNRGMCETLISCFFVEIVGIAVFQVFENLLDIMFLLVFGHKTVFQIIAFMDLEGM